MVYLRWTIRFRLSITYQYGYILLTGLVLIKLFNINVQQHTKARHDYRSSQQYCLPHVAQPSAIYKSFYRQNHVRSNGSICQSQSHAGVSEPLPESIDKTELMIQMYMAWQTGLISGVISPTIKVHWMQTLSMIKTEF